MAFKIRKRQAAEQVDGSTTSISSENTTTSSSSSNVVATQSWVHNILKGFWDWTNFFATKQARISGALDAGTIKTPELQANDIYATKFTLLDGEGRPAIIYIKDG